MKKMEFKVRQVRECLVREGRVYTVRSYYTGFEDMVWVDDIGRCVRKCVTEVKAKKDLDLFVTMSGFTSADDWWRVIESFCHGRRKWLYYVFTEKRAVWLDSAAFRADE